MSQSIHQHIVVCGTGIAGLSLSLALARRGQQVTLLGPKPVLPDAQPDTYHPRVYAISPASQAFLQSIGIWSLIPAGRLTKIEAMEVHGDRQGKLSLSAWQQALPELAWIVESGEIERALRQAIQVFGLHWIEEKCESWKPGVITTDKGREVRASLHVAADGARSALREAAGIQVDRRPYGVTALVAHLTCDLPHQGTACQWFRPDGVLALLPMPDTQEGHQVSMVWSIKEHLAEALTALPHDELVATLSTRLADATQGRLGVLTLRSKLHGFPLTLEQSPMVGERMALVGDAAHRLHPLAGQGLNLGLGDVQCLAETIAARELFREPGDHMVLARYRRARAEPVLAMRLVTDGLQKLFSVEAEPIAWLRNVGMDLVDRLPFIKRQIVSGAVR